MYHGLQPLVYQAVYGGTAVGGHTTDNSVRRDSCLWSTDNSVRRVYSRRWSTEVYGRCTPSVVHGVRSGTVYGVIAVGGPRCTAVYSRCTAVGGPWCTAVYSVRRCTVGVRHGGCTEVYGRCTARCTTDGLSVLLINTSWYRRPVSGWHLLARTGSPMATGHGYHLFSCHQMAPTPRPQVLPEVWQTSGNRACSVSRVYPGLGLRYSVPTVLTYLRYRIP